MSGMFWIALELSNSKMGLITRLTLMVLELIVAKSFKIVEFGNTGWNARKCNLKNLMWGLKLGLIPITMWSFCCYFFF